ncbi:PAS domain-containing protein [Allocoleopsis franciscana]|uniref:PAS domain S-box n=1 Tax=Allocoleopsis franciscana PCC 7113 TaxID=1173027 RepID=K9WJY6_9CYAN|nr:PAS domain S-box protein [Allocoleopsis franciscana]AFZ20064.1 PAS domain S-box [Allocoleopsis franciscana PCC 7113]
MASKIATFRLPENLIQEIRSRAEATGRDRTAVVIEALKQAFGMPASASRPATVEELQQQLNELEHKFLTLTQQLNQVSSKSPALSNISPVSPGLMQTIASGNSIPIPNSFVAEDAVSTQTLRVGEGSGRNGHQGGGGGGSRKEQELGFAEGKPDEAELQELAARIEQQARIFDLVLSASPDPICVVDRVGRFTYANLALAQLFGLPQGHILGKTWRQLELPTEFIDSEPIDGQREVVFATRRPLTKEISYRTNNGVRDYECILSPILGDSNTVEAVICTARDVTERNLVEESLRESESNYRHLFEYANDSIFIIDLSTSRILDANQNAARRLGYTRKELLKLKTKDIDGPVPLERQKTINQQLQATGSFIFEHALRRKDGTKIQVEISSRIIEYRDQLVSLSFVRDVTARKQAEERMRLLESAVENTQDGILITEAKHIDAPGPELLYVNQAFTRITGYDLTEVLGRTPRLLQGPKTDRSQLDKIRTALQEQKPVQVELLNYRKDGSEFWVELNIVPIASKEGKVTHWVALQREITERKQAEAALVASKQQISKILESITDGFFTVDEQWHFTYVNQKAEQILQKNRAELLGQNLWDVFPGTVGSTFEREFHRAINQDVAVTFEDFHPALGKWFEIHAYPSGDGLSVVCNDITKCKQAEVNS